MRLKAIITFPMLALACAGAHAEKAAFSMADDSLSYSLIGRAALPAAMFVTGSLYNDNILDRKIIHEGSVTSPGMKFTDYTQYAPAALMLGLKACGLEGRSDWERMIVSDAMSAGIMTVMVNGLKYTVRRERPDQRARNSFPSGHTATSFMAATMLHKEYGETVSPWFSVAGYGIATGTAICRVEANRHWCSDILAGAGIGIFSVEMGYELSDLLFGDKRLLRSTALTQVDEHATWEFSLQSSYSLVSKWSDAGFGHSAMKPACSLYVNADYMPWYVGATVSAGLTQLQWCPEEDSPLGPEVILPDGGSMPDLHFVGAGAAMDVPLAGRISLNGRAVMGGVLGHDYSLKYSDGNALDFKMPDGMRVFGNIGLSVRTTGNTAVQAYAGLDYYDKVWTSFTIGTQFTFMF